jgi:hypothetical protein
MNKKELTFTLKEIKSKQEFDKNTLSNPFIFQKKLQEKKRKTNIACRDPKFFKTIK